MKLLRLAPFALLCVALPVALPAARPLRSLQDPAGGGTVLVGWRDSWRVEAPGQLAHTVRLPPGGDLGSLAGFRGGWAAAGTRPLGSRSELLVLLAGPSGQVSRLPVPAGRTGDLRADPQPLVTERGMTGLAWLEGNAPRALEVRASEWTGVAFGPAVTVARRAAGTQIALTATVLEDGAWLLAWSAFDGEDDEILWSVRRDGVWSAPQDVGPDNDVPDITPQLLAAEGGALLAWSRYDGSDYRLMVARFDGQGWSPGEYVGGPGSVLPSLVAAGAGAHVLFRTALPRGWSVLQLDASGRVLRRASLATDRSERPRLEVEAGGPRLRWESPGVETALRWDGLP